jgi:hypothetical protein
MTTPYTYLIGWSQKNIWYYGVRYGKNCSPDDLWVKYFTSSKRVKKFIEKYGNPDVIQIRKTFKDKTAALKWECSVIKRLNIVEDSRWLNISNGSSNFANIGGYELPPRSKKHCEKISKAKTGISVFSEEEKLRRSKAYTGSGNPNYGRKYTKEQKINLLKGQGKYRPFFINGKEYELVCDAAKDLNMSNQNIKTRLNSDLLKWDEWRYFDDERVYRPHGTIGKKRPDLSERNRQRAAT